MSDYEDYGFDDIDRIDTEWGIFSVGDRIEVIVDNEEFGYFAEQEETDEQSAYPADEGVVVGFSKIEGGLFGPPRTAILVEFSGRDPIEVRPGDVLVMA